MRLTLVASVLGAAMLFASLEPLSSAPVWATLAERSAEKPRLVYSTATYRKVQGILVARYTIWIADANGRQARRLAGGGTSGGFSGPQISADGRWVAFGRNSDEYVISSEGGRARLLARDAVPLDWSPDSRHLAVDDNGTLVILDVETGLRVTIDKAGSIFGASFSPSGAEIAWARKRTKTDFTKGGVDIFRADVNGGARTRLTRSGGSLHPVWGPGLIAFSRFQPGSKVFPLPPYELWVVEPGGEGLRRLTRRTSLLAVGWSRDGRRLLACQSTEVSCSPSGVDPRRGTVRALADSLGFEPPDTEAFSRDGRFALVNSDGNLVRLRWSGRNPTVLVRGVAYGADWNR